MTFADAIYEATADCLTDSRTHVMGLGASYPNGLDGTMKDLATRYPSQVHDMPCSEAANTGLAVGMAINGLRPIVHHGRIEFSYYAFDQILTQAACWNAMFGGSYPCPLTIRVAMGRQWGNGLQHTRTMKSLFAVPGLNVVAPSTPVMANVLLMAASKADNPTIYLESRWLYKTQQTLELNNLHYECSDLRQALVLRKGTDITIVAVADMVLESLKAAKLLETKGISAEVVDVVSVYPLDYDTIHASIKKTGRAILVDASTPAYSVAHELRSYFNGIVITCPDHPCPTSPALTKNYYPSYIGIANAAAIQMADTVQFMDNRTFAELNLPPTDNFDTLIG